jgi:hypothetical protein
VTLHGGASACVTSDTNGVYSTCRDGSAVGSIVLGPGEGLQGITLSVLGETDGSTVDMTGLLSDPGQGTGTLNVGTVFSQANMAASSNPSGAFYALANAGTTITLEVSQSYTPNNAAGDLVEFQVSYQTRSCTPTSGASSGSVSSESAATASASSGGTCVPETCVELGVSCGQAGDGCGGVLHCGACPDAG